MKPRDVFDLILLAALWGGSFFFLRASVPEFGAIPMMMVRITLAGLFLLPFVVFRKKHKQMIQWIVPISVVGLFTSTFGFTLFAYSTKYVTAGFASVINASTPMFAVAIAYFWLKQKVTRLSIFGLVIGIVGVTLLVWDKIDFTEGGSGLAIVAGLAGAFCYGIAANYTKKHLVGVDPTVITTGSLLSAAVMLLPFAIYYWPTKMPSQTAWIHVLVLAIACTALAQILYFRLISRISATNATSVTFIIPVFGLLWGNLFLNEVIQVSTILACVVILLGTGMTIGLIKFPLSSSNRT